MSYNTLAINSFSLAFSVSSCQSEVHMMPAVDHHLCRFLVGSLAHPSVFTHTNTFIPVSGFPWQLHYPSYRHLSLVKRVARYVSNTLASSIQISPRSSAPLPSNVGSSWAGFNQTRRLITDIVITANDAPILWQLKRLALIVLSSVGRSTFWYRNARNMLRGGKHFL